MPDPGSRAYDTRRARLRDELERKGVPDATANDNANRVLQGEQTPQQAERARPGARPASRPGAEPTARPGAEPTARPGAEPTARPGAEPTARPGAEPTVRPGAQR